MVNSLDLVLLLIFWGFAISWIGGFAGLLLGKVVLFWKVFLSCFEFSEGLLFIFRFEGFAWDCELLTILGLLGFLGWLEIIFILSGLFKGFINNGFLFKLSLRGLPFTRGVTEDLFSLFFL